MEIAALSSILCVIEKFLSSSMTASWNLLKIYQENGSLKNRNTYIYVCLRVSTIEEDKTVEIAEFHSKNCRDVKKFQLTVWRERWRNEND